MARNYPPSSDGKQVSVEAKRYAEGRPTLLRFTVVCLFLVFDPLKWVLRLRSLQGGDDYGRTDVLITRDCR